MNGEEFLLGRQNGQPKNVSRVADGAASLIDDLPTRCVKARGKIYQTARLTCRERKWGLWWGQRAEGIEIEYGIRCSMGADSDQVSHPQSDVADPGHGCSPDGTATASGFWSR